MESSSIPISIFRQYLFCPRIVYFQEILGLHISMPVWTKQGDLHHKKQIILSKERTLKRFELDKGKMLFDLSLESEVYNIHGICDGLIETDEEIVPIDFKLTNSLQRGHLFQLLGYALCAEEKYQKKSQIGFILTGEKAKANVIEFSSVLRGEFFNILKNIERILDKQILPETCANEHQCGQCEYFNYCNDRF